MDKELAVVIMAAGKGTRMKNPDMAKVMYTVNGKPMVEHVVDLALSLNSAKTIVIVGWHKESVIAHCEATGKPVVCVEQSPQLGTGHAVMQAEMHLADFAGDVLVLSGDVPLLSTATVRNMLRHHRTTAAVATVLTAMLDNPSGYGRILRGPGGNVVGIVEQKDASAEQRQIQEINSGIYVFDRERLFDGLHHITPDNAQHEYYLTDVFRYFWRHRYPVHAECSSDYVELRGVNTFEQLEEARAVLEGRPQNART
jgi:UDP-N-acetylglucosamine pyrophosphorylase